MAAGSCSCWLAPASGSSRLELAELKASANILRLPFATASACLLKTTSVTVSRYTKACFARKINGNL